MGRKKVLDEAIQRALEEGRRIYPPLEDKSATIRFIGFPENTDKYVLQTRYEHWGKNGKEFCNWFKVKSGNDVAELEKEIPVHKKMSAYTKMKLKEEYRVIPVEEA